MKFIRFVRILPVALLAAALCSCEVPRPPAPPEAPRVVESLRDFVSRGDTAGARRMIAAGADIHETDAEGATLLHVAAFRGDAAMLALLLDAGAAVNARDQFLFTPLHAAAREGHFDAVRLLDSRGADRTLPDESGLTPADVARFMGHTAIADFLAPPEPVLAIVPEAPVEPEPEPPPAILLTGESFRVWTSLTGAQLEAEFVQNVLDVVMLRKTDGNLVRIALAQLTAADQQLARQLSGHAAPALARSRARESATVRGPDDSIGLRIGRSSGWTVLENARLLKRSGNDADSFHVQHEGKEYIFRLYYVDAPETNLSFPERVREQAEYFELSPDDMLRLGKEGTRFTERVLSRGSFTVVTRWEDARGNSRLPRHYAFIVTDQGDLDELLMAEGLVRLYGMRVDGSAGSRKFQTLKNLEDSAKRERMGAWGITRQARASRANQP
ncbi:MAG TPA: ankyrin repeat domain-containing protein [Kiritimatiellia bacterium]|nr:ankyrin repeat domain-containing protein [Kiritimatiellia bacterium]